MESLHLGSALDAREWAAMRLLAAAVAYRELTAAGASPAAWLAAHDELARAVDRFVAAMGEQGDASCVPR